MLTTERGLAAEVVRTLAAMQPPEVRRGGPRVRHWRAGHGGGVGRPLKREKGGEAEGRGPAAARYNA